MSFDPTEFAAVGLILVGMCGVVLAAFWRPFTQGRDRFARRLDLSRSQRRLLRLLSESLGEPNCLPRAPTYDPVTEPPGSFLEPKQEHGGRRYSHGFEREFVAVQNSTSRCVYQMALVSTPVLSF